MTTHTITRAWVAAAVAAVLFGVGARAEIKVGVFDAQLISESTDWGQRYQAELKAFTERKEGEIAAKQEKLSELRQQLSQQALSLSPDKRTALEKQIQREALDLQTLQESAQRELDLEIASATRNFQEKLVLAVEAFGKDEGFSVLLDRSQVAWADTAIDVTSAIVDKVNTMFPVDAGE